MTTSFPNSRSGLEGQPKQIYQRGIDAVTDVYIVESGPLEKKGWGVGLPLFFVETEPNEQPDIALVDQHAQEKGFQQLDAQEPRQMTHEELTGKLNDIEEMVAHYSRGEA